MTKLLVQTQYQTHNETHKEINPKGRNNHG